MRFLFCINLKVKNDNAMVVYPQGRNAFRVMYVLETSTP